MLMTSNLITTIEKDKYINGFNRQEELTELELPINNFYHAFNTKNFKLMKKVWANEEYISMENPAGGMRFGWNDLENVYLKVLKNTSNIQAGFFNYRLYRNQNTFWSVGYEKVILNLDSEKRVLFIRVTRIFELYDNLWKLVHLHGSFEDPIDLAFYQKVTKSN
ncbi:nuclear transport factor 2 family protein [Liquorilactobacillus capillatus]|uniref:nuclear transport factor 2 family protein n=1 Tax=Liquorilactobacillus capillatus TaxID=480931 RepID=UPI00070AECEB|nr:nuclear transport factor 2 family protein [Liquorilactobacillus capillatus]